MSFKRLLLFWFLAFVSSLVISSLMVLAWRITGFNNLFLVVGTLNGALVYLFFGWLYFRPGFAILLSDRIKSTALWIVLDFLFGMVVASVLSGVSPLKMFSASSYLVEIVNFVALMLAAYLAIKKPQQRSELTSPQSLVQLLPEPESTKKRLG